jgi:hypothetical protein
MIHDKKLLGACGETELANAKQSIITMMQVRVCNQTSNQFATNRFSGLRVLHLPSHGEGV